MTTIAYRDGILAADSMLTGYDADCGSVIKIRRNRHGWLGGASGNKGSTTLFMDWFLNTPPRIDVKPAPTVDDNSADGIVILPGGRVFFWSGSAALWAVIAPFHTLGSGMRFAMGAMAMGASAREAVGVAKKFDVYTGGRIATLSLAPAPGRKSS